MMSRASFEFMQRVNVQPAIDARNTPAYNPTQSTTPAPTLPGVTQPQATPTGPPLPTIPPGNNAATQTPQPPQGNWRMVGIQSNVPAHLPKFSQANPGQRAELLDLKDREQDKEFWNRIWSGATYPGIGLTILGTGATMHGLGQNGRLEATQGQLTELTRHRATHAATADLGKLSRFNPRRWGRGTEIAAAQKFLSDTQPQFDDLTRRVGQITKRRNWQMGIGIGVMALGAFAWNRHDSFRNNLTQNQVNLQDINTRLRS